jgi:hypothetical protein
MCARSARRARAEANQDPALRPGSSPGRSPSKRDATEPSLRRSSRCVPPHPRNRTIPAIPATGPRVGILQDVGWAGRSAWLSSRLRRRRASARGLVRAEAAGPCWGGVPTAQPVIVEIARQPSKVKSPAGRVKRNKKTRDDLFDRATTTHPPRLRLGPGIEMRRERHRQGGSNGRPYSILKS